MIEARYTLSFEEWAEGQEIWCKARGRKTPGAKLLAYLWWALAILGGAAFAAPPHIFGAALLLIMFAQHSVVRWRRKPLLQAAYNDTTDRERESFTTIDEHGYTSKRPDFNECRMTWRCFSGWREGKLTFVLGRGAQYCCLPKRALSLEQTEELRALLRAHIS